MDWKLFSKVYSKVIQAKRELEQYDGFFRLTLEWDKYGTCAYLEKVQQYKERLKVIKSVKLFCTWNYVELEEVVQKIAEILDMNFS